MHVDFKLLLLLLLLLLLFPNESVSDCRYEFTDESFRSTADLFKDGVDIVQIALIAVATVDFKSKDAFSEIRKLHPVNVTDPNCDDGAC